jgi:hypothetical protein
MRTLCCLCVCMCSPSQLSNASFNFYETRYVYNGTWTHFNGVLHKSLPSICVCICIALSLLDNGSVNTSRQRLHATIEELLDASFSLRSLYQRSICASVYPSSVARQRFGKHVAAAMKNYWVVARLPGLWESKLWSWVPRDSEPRITVLVRTSSNLPDRTKNCWRCRFLCGPCRIKGK